MLAVGKCSRFAPKRPTTATARCWWTPFHPSIRSFRPSVRSFRSVRALRVPCRVFWPLGLGSQSVSQLVSHRASSVAQSGNTIGPQGNHSPFISINGEVRCGGWRFTTDDDCSREWRFVICRTSIAAKSRLGRGTFPQVDCVFCLEIDYFDT